MPVCRIKRGERPGEPHAGKTAIHHWIFLDVRGVIQSDELMPDYLRINPKRHYGQTEQDEQIGSPECCSVAERHGASSVGCGKANSFSLLRCPFGHAVCETTRARTWGIKESRPDKGGSSSPVVTR